MNLSYKYRLMTFKYQMSLHSCEMTVIHVLIYYYKDQQYSLTARISDFTKHTQISRSRRLEIVLMRLRCPATLMGLDTD